MMPHQYIPTAQWPSQSQSQSQYQAQSQSPTPYQPYSSQTDYYSPPLPPPQQRHWSVPVQQPQPVVYPQTQFILTNEFPTLNSPLVTESPICMDETYEFICKYGRDPLPGELGALSNVAGSGLPPTVPVVEPTPPAAEQMPRRLSSASSSSSPPATTTQPGRPHRTKSVPWRTRCQCPSGPPRTHPERHWRNSCPSNPEGSCKLQCPFCPVPTSGMRKDNFKRHLEKKHPGVKLEDLDGYF